jgi:hypothetical protein
MLERAGSLPSLEERPRHARALLENELACARAQMGAVEEARKLLRAALGRSPDDALRAALMANLAMLERWKLDRSSSSRERDRGASLTSTSHDFAHDPYTRLDCVVFRMMPVWGELPAPPPTRLVPARLKAAAQPGEAQPRIAAHRALGDAER